MDALQQMYQQVILEHAKKPHGRVPGLPSATGVPGITSATVGLKHDDSEPGVGISHQVNPTCGDEITLQVEVRDGQIAGLTWQGQGCSISQASASIMTELVNHNPVADAQELNKLFHELMSSRGKGLDDADEEKLEDAVAFTGTSLYPARIKCALLGWEALKDALSKAEVSQ